MALSGKQALVIAKSYTDETVEGGGAIKGKNCTVDSITSISGGNRVTFKWTLDDGTVKTGTMDVMNGTNGTNGTNGAPGVDGKDGKDGDPGLGIKEVEVTNENHLIVTFDDNTEQDAGEITTLQGEPGEDGEDGADGFSPTVVVKESTASRYVLTITDKNGSYDTPNLKGSGGGATDLDDLDDVEFTTLKDGQIMVYDNDSKKFVNEDMPNFVLDANYVHTDNNYNDTAKSIVDGVTAALSNKVDKNGTDSLMSADEHTKLSGIAAGAEVNTIIGVQVNSIDLTPDANRKVNINISGKADKVVSATNGNFAVLDTNGNLVDSQKSPSSYYLKTETYTKSEVDSLVGAIATMNIAVVNELPTTNISKTTLYLVPKSVGTSTSNIYDEYVNTTGTTAGWEKIGDTQIDLTNYLQKSATSGLVKNDGSIDTNTYATSSSLSSYIQKSNTAGLVKNDGSIDQSTYATTGSLSNYVQKSETAGLIKNDGTIDTTTYASSSTVSGKADKVTTATANNFAGFDSNGNLKDSGSKASDFLTSHQDISGKADKVQSATNGHFAGLDASGNLTDSGSKASDFLTSHQPVDHWLLTTPQTLAANTTSVSFSISDLTKGYEPYFETADNSAIILKGRTITTSGSTGTITYTINAVTSAQAASNGCKANLRMLV